MARPLPRKPGSKIEVPIVGNEGVTDTPMSQFLEDVEKTILKHPPLTHDSGFQPDEPK